MSVIVWKLVFWISALSGFTFGFLAMLEGALKQVLHDLGVSHRRKERMLKWYLVVAAISSVVALVSYAFLVGPQETVPVYKGDLIVVWSTSLLVFVIVTREQWSRVRWIADFADYQRHSSSVTGVIERVGDGGDTTMYTLEGDDFVYYVHHSMYSAKVGDWVKLWLKPNEHTVSTSTVLLMLHTVQQNEKSPTFPSQEERDKQKNYQPKAKFN